MKQNSEDKKLIGKLTIHLYQDGEAKFYPETDYPELSAKKFSHIVQILYDNPHLVGHAFNVCKRHVHN